MLINAKGDDSGLQWFLGATGCPFPLSRSIVIDLAKMTGSQITFDGECGSESSGVTPVTM